MRPLRAAVHGLLGRLGYDLRRRDERATLAGVLGNARRLGLAPATVIDVGAARGDFTRVGHRLFPDAAFLMVEPLAEFAPGLARVAAEVPRARHVAVAAAAKAGEVTLNVHPDLVGSSFFREDEDSDVNGVPRTVAAAPLDDLVREHGLAPPFLLKIDVQGAELEVVAGAADVLAGTAMAILEVSFFRFFAGAPTVVEAVAAMAGRGFVPYDAFGLSHRPLDGALAQADIAFVPAEGALRARHAYATRAQREALTRRLRPRP